MTTMWQHMNYNEVFAEHDRCMKLFYKSHPPIPRVSKLSRRELMEKMWPLLVINVTSENGGTSGQMSAAQWSILPLMRRVGRMDLSPN